MGVPTPRAKNRAQRGRASASVLVVSGSASRPEPQAGSPDRAPLAVVRVTTPISVIVPTFRERENLPVLLERLDGLRREHGLELEVLVMDDDSRDGSAEYVASSGYAFAELVTRTTQRGLSPAVLEGMARAKHPVLVVMDADLSHPPEVIPHMILALEAGQEFVFGSRYVAGGSTDDDWGFLRWLNSKVATLLARPLTSATDPMAGFFAFRRTLLARAESFDPVGYKIGLEVIVRCHVTNVGEVPIRFTDRTRGESKLSLRVQLQYLKHLYRLYLHQFGVWFQIAQFLAVGFSGMLVNLGLLTALLWFGVRAEIALGVGIGVSMLTNFALNRRFTFSYARGRAWQPQLGGFLLACSVGAAVNYGVATALHRAFPETALQVVAIGGILAGTVFNFVANRFLVFRAQRATQE